MKIENGIYQMDSDNYGLEFHYYYEEDKGDYQNPPYKDLEINKVILTSKYIGSEYDIEWIKTDVTDFYFENVDYQHFLETIEDNILNDIEKNYG